MRKTLLKWLIRFSLFMLLFIGLAFWLLTSKGDVAQRSVASKDVVAAHSLLADSWSELRLASNGITVELEQAELDALLNVASHALKPLIFHGAIMESFAVLHAALPLPAVFGDRILHGYCWFSSREHAFVVESCQFGKVTIPGRLAMFLLRSTTRFLIEAPADEQLLVLFQHGQVSDFKLRFNQHDAVAIAPKLAQRVYTGWRLGNNLTRSQQGLAPDVDIYLQYLQQLATQHPDEIRLAFFLQKLLIEVDRKTNGKPSELELRSALWAMAIGFGNRSFIRYAKPDMQPDTVPRLPDAVLAGRRDLTLHFLYSAVIKMVGNVHIAEQIGHLKELHDAGDGGSGFSFVDIAANKAGMWFVQHLASINIERAYQLDTEAFEITFMPALHDLPEGIPEARFQQQYGGLNGEGTLRLFDMMDSRIASLSLFSAK